MEEEKEEEVKGEMEVEIWEVEGDEDGAEVRRLWWREEEFFMEITVLSREDDDIETSKKKLFTVSYF